MICYRREDGQAYANRLYDSLSKKFGKNSVFLDIDSIQPGADFEESIATTIPKCDVVIVVIARHWVNALRERNPASIDFVKLEIATALESGVRVIPVLFGGAEMPTDKELPEILHSLHRRQAVEVSDRYYHQDVDRLIKAIEGPSGPRRSAVSKWIAIVSSVSVGLVACAWGTLSFRLFQPTLPVAASPHSSSAREEQPASNRSDSGHETYRSASVGDDEMISIYSTSYGGVALDRQSDNDLNGLFTKFLLQYIRQPGIELRDVLSEVQKRVLAESGGRQRSWWSVSNNAKFFLFPAPVHRRGRSVSLGNGSYRSGVVPLNTSAKDARDVRSLLGEAGFETRLVLDANRAGILESLQYLSEFHPMDGHRVTRSIQRAEPYEVALFYYSGHAVGIRGQTYILPIDFDPTWSEREIESVGVAESTIRSALDESGAHLKILILDACRNQIGK
jgi:hypothetical protein